MTNITMVALPNGRWQLWDGPDGKDGKSPTMDYSQPLLWKQSGFAYYAHTAYFGEEVCIRFTNGIDWPLTFADKSVA